MGAEVGSHARNEEHPRPRVLEGTGRVRRGQEGPSPGALRGAGSLERLGLRLRLPEQREKNFLLL